MNLAVKYLGLSLKNPLVAGASPLVDDIGKVRQLEDAGAGAVVMHSLFAEQIEGEAFAQEVHLERWEESFAEAPSFFPEATDFALGPDEYLERILDLKRAVDIPIIASLNGTHPGNWTEYADLIEQAGADALELNTYLLPTSRDVGATELEMGLLDIVREVRAMVKLPIAVKLSPFYSSIANLVGRLEDEGVEGVVLFNRFFQPAFDLEELMVTPRLDLSAPEDLRLRLRWLGILHDQVDLSLACSGGVHSPGDVVRAILAGADAVQVVALLLKLGPSQMGWLLNGLTIWLEEHEYSSVNQLRGALSRLNCPDSTAYERGNYLRTLQLWRA